MRLLRACFSVAERRSNDWREIAAIRFDKTGTLTTGSATVSQFVDDGCDATEVILARAATLASASLHPMSHAIGEFVAVRRVELSREINGDPGHSGARDYRETLPC